MSRESLNYFYKNFADEQMNFLFTGDFNDELTDKLISLNNSQFKNRDEFKNLQKRAAFLIAECFQNIVRHSDLSNINSYFHIKNNFGVFSLVSGNTIQNLLAPLLQTQLEQLNKLTNEELRDAYRKKLDYGKFSIKGGAGLGLIEMARKTKNKLTFRFVKVDQFKSYFYFKLLLHAAELIKKPATSNFDNDISLRKRMMADNLFIVYHGVISTEATSVLLNIIHNTFQSIRQKTAYLKLMSFIEHLSTELSSIEIENNMMLTVGQNDDEYTINTAFIVNNLQAKTISKSFDSLKIMDQKTLLNEQNKLTKEGMLERQMNYRTTLLDLFTNSSTVAFEEMTNANGLSHISISLNFDKSDFNDSEISESIEKKTEIQFYPRHINLN